MAYIATRPGEAGFAGDFLTSKMKKLLFLLLSL